MPVFLICREQNTNRVLQETVALITITCDRHPTQVPLPIEHWQRWSCDRWFGIEYCPFSWYWQTASPKEHVWECLQFIENRINRYGYDSSFAIYSCDQGTCAATLALLLYAYWLRSPEAAIQGVLQQWPALPLSFEPDWLLLRSLPKGRFKPRWVYAIESYFERRYRNNGRSETRKSNLQSTKIEDFDLDDWDVDL